MKISDLNQLKGQMKTAARDWAFAKIDELTTTHPRLVPVSVYLRRGVTNLIARYDEQMNRTIDRLALFLCDERGVYDTDMIVDDLCEMFDKTPRGETELLGATITYGQGEVCIDLPGGAFVETLLGDLSKIRFTTDDFKELKTMFNP